MRLLALAIVAMVLPSASAPLVSVARCLHRSGAADAEVIARPRFVVASFTPRQPAFHGRVVYGLALARGSGRGDERRLVRAFEAVTEGDYRAQPLRLGISRFVAAGLGPLSSSEVAQAPGRDRASRVLVARAARAAVRCASHA